MLLTLMATPDGILHGAELAAAKRCNVGQGETNREYLVGPGDELGITFQEAEEASAKLVIVDPTGHISLVMAGRVRAAGLSTSELRNEITGKLAKYFVDPHVSVNVVQYRSQPVSVIGSVNTAGVHYLQGKKTLIEVLSLAGGLRPDAGSVIKVTRSATRGGIDVPRATLDASGEFCVAEINLDQVTTGEHPDQNITIEANDVVAVERAPLVYVIGEVKKAGGFIIRRDERLSALQAIALAEGLLRTASGSNAKILRAQNGANSRTELRINIGKILSGKSPDVPLLADDILFIPNSAAKNALLKSAETGLQIATGVVIWRR